MSWTLLKKELAEHGWVFAIALALNVAVLFICLTSQLNDGRFSALAVHLKMTLVATAMVAGNRLIVREYLERTRLFLESLPVPRATVLGTKWLIGAGYVVASAAVLTGITARYVGTTEVITGGDVARALSRAALAGLGCWSAAFLAGIVGHARMVFWVTLLGGVPVLASALNTEAFRMPPFSLLGDHFGAAHDWPSAIECTLTLAWSALSTGTAAVMVLSRDGAIAQAMTRKIAARDLVVVAAVLFTFGAVAKALEVRAERPTFTLENAVHGKRTSVSTTEEVDEALARALATKLDHALGDLEAAIAVDLRTLWVIPSSGLSPNRVVRLPHPANGPVASANLTHPHFDLEQLAGWATHGALDRWTHERANREPRHWFLDGFSYWWVSRNEPEWRSHDLVRAARIQRDLTRADFEAWRRTMSRHGHIADALARAAVQAFVDLKGEAAVMRVAKAFFQPLPTDVRALVLEQPIDALLASEGVSLDELLTYARRSLPAPTPSPTADWHATVRTANIGGRQIELTVVLDAPAGTPWSVYATRLGPWPATPSYDECIRLDTTEPELVLPLPLFVDDQVLVQVEVYDETVHAPVRLIPESQFTLR